MKNAARQKIFDKYNGLCAYTGKPLGNDWQIDHANSKAMHRFGLIRKQPRDINDNENLLPAVSIVNHYKRALDVEGFRCHMRNFHKRLARLPKNPKVIRSQRRKDYMLKIAELFDITPTQPFSGKFYFETLQTVINEENHREG